MHRIRSHVRLLCIDLRSQALSLVIVEGARIVEVRRARVSGDDRRARILRAIDSAAKQYAVDMIVIDERHGETVASMPLYRRVVCVPRTLIPRETRARDRPTNREYCLHVLTIFPVLARFVTNRQGHPVLTDRKRTGVLLAAGLALDAAHLVPPGERAATSNERTTTTTPYAY